VETGSGTVSPGTGELVTIGASVLAPLPPVPRGIGAQALMLACT